MQEYTIFSYKEDVAIIKIIENNDSIVNVNPEHFSEYQAPTEDVCCLFLHRSMLVETAHAFLN